MTTTLRAIETRYKGYRFRSRLEARWAVFFDAAHIAWSYEPEGYVLPSGRHYLPDFILRNVGLRTTKETRGILIEVKPTRAAADNAAQDALAQCGVGLDMPAVMLIGDVPSADGGGAWDGHLQLTPWWDNNMYFARCQRCGRMKIEFCESSYEDCSACGGLCRFGSDDAVLAFAERSARSARFEHGEVPR